MKFLTTTITTLINKLIGFISPEFSKNLTPIKVRVQNKKNRFN